MSHPVTVRPYFMPGHVLFMGACTITGKPHSISAKCSLAHARANARRDYPTLTDCAWIADSRYGQALAIRSGRAKRRSYQRELEAVIDADDFPSIELCRRAADPLGRNLPKRTA